MSHPYVVVVILNNNRYSDTVECLNALSRSSYQNYEVLVLNLPPITHQLEPVFAEHPNVEILTLAENRGYAGNNNIGIKLALERGADWVLVLNDDTVMAPDCLELLVKTGLSSDAIGLVGPMVFHYDEPDIIQSAGGILDKHWESRHLGRNEADTGQFAAPHRVDWLSGCALMVKRDVLIALGGFDEDFFMYWEEVDLCLQARNLHWAVMHMSHAKLWHKGSLRRSQPPPYVTYYSFRNLFLLLQKHHAPLLARLYHWAQAIRTLVTWTVRPKWRLTKREHRDALWQGMRDVVLRRWGMKS